MFVDPYKIGIHIKQKELEAFYSDFKLKKKSLAGLYKQNQRIKV